MLLQSLADAFLGLGAGDGGGIEPALQFGAGGGLVEVGGIGADVEGEDQGDSDGFHAVLVAPVGGYEGVGGWMEGGVAAGWMVLLIVSIVSVVVVVCISIEQSVVMQQRSHRDGVAVLHDDGGRIVECPSRDCICI